MQAGERGRSETHRAGLKRFAKPSLHVVHRVRHPLRHRQSNQCSAQHNTDGAQECTTHGTKTHDTNAPNPHESPFRRPTGPTRAALGGTGRALCIPAPVQQLGCKNACAGETPDNEPPLSLPPSRLHLKTGPCYHSISRGWAPEGERVGTPMVRPSEPRGAGLPSGAPGCCSDR